MNKPTEQNPSTKTGNANRDPSDPRGERKDFRETGQEANPESAKDDIKAPAKDDVKPPMHADKGNG